MRVRLRCIYVESSLSFPCRRLAKHFGGRDHTTVMHADRKIRQLMAERRSIYNQVNELTTSIKQQAIEQQSSICPNCHSLPPAGDNLWITVDIGRYNPWITTSGVTRVERGGGNELGAVVPTPFHFLSHTLYMTNRRSERALSYPQIIALVTTTTFIYIHPVTRITFPHITTYTKH